MSAQERDLFYYNGVSYYLVGVDPRDILKITLCLRRYNNYVLHSLWIRA